MDYQPIGRDRPRAPVSRRIMPSLVIATFVVVLLWMGITQDYSRLNVESTPHSVTEGWTQDKLDEYGKNKWPDFSQYVHLRTIPPTHLDIEKPDKRLILVGDVHGMDHSLEKLLRKVKYNSKDDTLIHLGDIIAKGPQSMEVLERMSSQNVTGVRGNHDQMVVEWRAYMDWLATQPGGRQWFHHMVQLNLSPKEFKKLGKKKKKYDIPEGWEWGGEHWEIAKAMNEKHYQYLLQLPLVLHLPSLHTHLVHAGILPADPTRSLHDRRQPLAHLPVPYTDTSDKNIIRSLQEEAILNEIPQNRDGWTKINMRDIHKGKPSRRTNGTPWSEYWNHVQELCQGFPAKKSLSRFEVKSPGESEEDAEHDIFDEPSEDLRKKALKCMPTTVVYGHAAGRGLDIKRWTQGIDTGCVYGRRLTAMIIGSPKSKDIDDAGDEEELEEVRFGDTSKARLVSVNCEKP